MSVSGSRRCSPHEYTRNGDADEHTNMYVHVYCIPSCERHVAGSCLHRYEYDIAHDDHCSTEESCRHLAALS